MATIVESFPNKEDRNRRFLHLRDVEQRRHVSKISTSKAGKSTYQVTWHQPCPDCKAN